MADMNWTIMNSSHENCGRTFATLSVDAEGHVRGPIDKVLFAQIINYVHNEEIHIWEYYYWSKIKSKLLLTILKYPPFSGW